MSGAVLVSAKDEVDKLLKSCGAVLTRHKKHEVWKLPNGQKFTRAQTPSDRRAEARNLSDLKHTLGMVKTVTTIGKRRMKKSGSGPATTTAYSKSSVNIVLADKLRISGVTEQALKDRIEELGERIVSLQVQLETAESSLLETRQLAESREIEILSCWQCRLRRWWKHRTS